MATQTPQTYSSQLLEVPDSVSDATTELLASYSGIPKEQQVQHIVDVRNKVYERYPYPCLGIFRFLNLDLSAHKLYSEEVLRPLQGPVNAGEVEPLFLDLGCCFGQDVRKLVFDGAQPHRLWASDIVQDLIDYGFELFRDGDRLPKDHFLCPGDLLHYDNPDDKLKVLDGRVTILHMTAVFHLFEFEDQKKVVDRCLRLFRKDAGKPVLLLGSQVGSDKAGHFFRSTDADHSHKYRHNVESWDKLWSDVCGRDEWKDTIQKLDVRSELVGRQQYLAASDSKVDSQQPRRHTFEVRVTFN